MRAGSYTPLHLMPGEPGGPCGPGGPESPESPESPATVGAITDTVAGVSVRYPRTSCSHRGRMDPPIIGDIVKPSSPPRFTLREPFLLRDRPPPVVVFSEVSASIDAVSSDSLTIFNFSSNFACVSEGISVDLFTRSVSCTVPCNCLCMFS